LAEVQVDEPAELVQLRQKRDASRESIRGMDGCAGQAPVTCAATTITSSRADSRSGDEDMEMEESNGAVL
jgi:hypothetical protein